MSKINLQRGKLTVENRKSREKKRICSEVSVNSPGNPFWYRPILVVLDKGSLNGGVCMYDTYMCNIMSVSCFVCLIPLQQSWCVGVVDTAQHSD